MSGYENAPATKMVATHCACCGRALVDAKSVETGVGPDCRKKYGYEIEGITEEQRLEANKLVYSIAAHQTGPQVVDACRRLFELGFTQLIIAILRRVATVQVALTDDTHPHGPGRLAVRCPYSEEAVAALRQVPGRRWDGESKLNTFPADSKGPLYAVLQKLYKGQTAIGPKGPFIIGQATTQAPATFQKATVQ